MVLTDLQKKGKEEVRANRIPNTQPSHDLATYTGTFKHGGYGSINIELEGEQLQLQYNNIEMPLEHFHYDSFIFTHPAFDLDFRATFTVNASGDIESLAIPFEARVSDIIFKRVANHALYERSYREQFTGEYQIMLGEQAITVSITLQGDMLIANTPGQANTELEPYKENTFRLKIAPSQIISFRRDDQGQISEILLPGGVRARHA